MRRQLELIERRPALPEGFAYEAAFLSPDEERELAARIAGLELKPFEYYGYLGKRRVVSFGWKYDYKDRALGEAVAMPGFLTAVRERAAAFAGTAPSAFEQALVTEYRVGTEIGWHKDRPEFGEVVGISLLAPCIFRFRRKHGEKWERASLTVASRSAYLLRGPSRTEWQHSIPAVEALRYSVTFRTLRHRSA